jgi:GNAT superfamily N-acetyltransferase
LQPRRQRRGFLLMSPEWRRENYRVSTDPAELDVTAIHAFLSHTYWSEDIPRAVVERALQHSLCFGLFDGHAQVGLARVITDYATFAYLCDVYVRPSHQGRGLGTWLIECVMAHPELQGLRRLHLVTRDAHGLYAKFGFQPVAKPAMHMEIHKPGIYKTAANT